MSNRKQKDWWWGYFDTHPDLEKKLPTAYANEKERRPKVMCKACKISRIIDEQQADRESQRQGLQNDVRTQEQIIGYCKFSIPVLLIVVVLRSCHTFPVWS
jgi:hypothetical protein